MGRNPREPMADPIPSIRADGTLIEAYAGLSMFGNSATGLGTSRDKTEYYAVQQILQPLSSRELVALVRSSRLCRRAVFAYPDAAISKGWTWKLGSSKRLKPNAIKEYERRIDLRKSLHLASIEARWYGNGYVLLGIDDGLPWEEPVDESRIKSIVGTKVLFDHEVNPWTSGEHEPEYYQITVSRAQAAQAGESMRKVHRSRIIHLGGDRLVGQALIDRNGKHDSVLQNMFRAFAAFDQAMMASSAMMQDYSVFLYKLRGLARLAEGGERDKLMNRFLAIQMGMSVVKGLACDADQEDASFISRNYGGVDAIVMRLQEVLVASSDLPRVQLFGSASQEGLGSQGRGQEERFEWARLVQDWQHSHWHEELLRVGRYMLLAKNSPTRGRGVEDLELEFPTILQLTQKEELELRKIKAEIDSLNINNGKYTKLEARLSEYGGSDWDYNVTLDPSVTSVMQEEQTVKLEEAVMPTEEKLAIQSSTAPSRNQPPNQQERKDDLSDSEFDEFAFVDESALTEVLEDIADASET